jgi:hypothetical protein
VDSNIIVRKGHRKVLISGSFAGAGEGERDATAFSGLIRSATTPRDAPTSLCESRMSEDSPRRNLGGGDFCDGDGGGVRGPSLVEPPPPARGVDVRAYVPPGRRNYDVGVEEH